MLRAVLDTNVVLAAQRSTHPQSPNVEILVADLLQYAEEVPIRFFHFRHYPVDADDVAFLLLALNGDATHLVTYDEHLKDVGVFYPEFMTCEPLPFLASVRADLTP